jgi:hypothetical protein
MSHSDGIDDRLLIGKEAVQSSNREAGLDGNSRGRDLIEQHLAEQGTGGIEHALDGMLATDLYWRTTARQFRTFLQNGLLGI